MSRAPRCDVVWRMFVREGLSIPRICFEFGVLPEDIEEAIRRAYKRLQQRPRPKWRKGKVR